VSPKKDGSADLIGIFDCNPGTYRDWAVYYYEREIPLAAVKAVYDHYALSEDLVAVLNPECTLSQVSADTLEIGYPFTPSTGSG